MRVFLLLFILLQFNLFANENIKSILVVSESWDGYTNKDGSGLYFDVVRAIYEPVGIKVKVKIYPYSRTTDMVKNKKADLWLASYIDEEDYAVYPKYYFDQDVVTAMYKTKYFPNFVGEESLKNKNVCWVRGYDIDEYMDVPVIKNERNDRKSILLGLEKDRFDFFLDDRDDMQNAIEKNNFDTKAYSFRELYSFKLYPAFRDDKRGKILRDIWDKRFEKLLKSGELKKIYVKNNLEGSYLYE